mmetsp:Transcript_17417/g.36227  ORF Transcript_17417/g.36227 Transcript_17417/m.36227 type:complete len:327 (-) Transcript_17417:214-1194(-)
MAHSDGLPAYLSAADLSPGVTPSQLTVMPHPPACHIVSRMAAMNTFGGGRDGASTTSRHKIDNGTGGLCAWMTLVGIGRGGPLVPGTRVGIHVAFPNRQDELYDDDTDFGEFSGIIPCHRVCCALVGEEYALCDGVSLGTSASSSSASTAAASAGKKRTKTRSYVFDSTYELVEYGYTDSISLGLVLPQDSPVTVKTDLVEVVVTLKVEFTVDRAVILRRRRVNCGMGNDSMSCADGLGNDYDEISRGSLNELSVIRLDLPCEVVHYGSDHDVGGENKHEEHLSSILRRCCKDNECPDSRAGDAFDCSDIQHDLKMLSLRMMRYFE